MESLTRGEALLDLLFASFSLNRSDMDFMDGGQSVHMELDGWQRSRTCGRELDVTHEQCPTSDECGFSGFGDGTRNI